MKTERAKHTILVQVWEEEGKFKIRISGVTSGFVVHTDYDDSSIVFGLDKSRFMPKIEINGLVEVRRT